MGKERRTSLVQEKVYNHSENGGKVSKHLKGRSGPRVGDVFY